MFLRSICADQKDGLETNQYFQLTSKIRFHSREMQIKIKID